MHRRPPTRSELPLSLLLGTVFALALFVAMAVVQMLGDVDPGEKQIDETMIAFNPPDIEEFEEETPPEEEEEEPPPELEKEPPQLSLDQLDIALNPGTGGALEGDFAMPTIATSGNALGTEDFVDFSDLDRIPEPQGVAGLNFPRRLKKKKVDGKIVLLIRLDSTGEVLDVELLSSDLPAFNDHVVGEVKEWRFTPPTRHGQPVKAKARLPIPIHIS